MFRKKHAKKLIKRGIILDGKNFEDFRLKLIDLLRTKNRVLVGISGSPGSSKSLLAGKIEAEGFLVFQRKNYP